MRLSVEAAELARGAAGATLRNTTWRHRRTGRTGRPRGRPRKLGPAVRRAGPGRPPSAFSDNPDRFVLAGAVEMQTWRNWSLLKGSAQSSRPTPLLALSPRPSRT